MADATFNESLDNELRPAISSCSDDCVDRWLQRCFFPYVDLRPGSRVLDLCCGDGVWSFGLLRAEQDLDITGVDVFSSVVECAVKRAADLGVADRTHFDCRDVQGDFSLPLDHYDLIFARDLFFYNQQNMMRPASLRLLEYWYKLLSDNGVFYASYGSKPDVSDESVLSSQASRDTDSVPFRSHAVDFKGGTHDHTMYSFLEPFVSIPLVEVRNAVCLSGRYVLVSGCRKQSRSGLLASVRDLCRTPLVDEREVTRENSPVLERPSLMLVVSDTHFIEGDELYLQVYPPLQDKYEIEMRGPAISKVHEVKSNDVRLKDLVCGKYRFRARYYSGAESEWSLPLDVTFHEDDDEGLVQKARCFQHRLALICEKDINGVVVATDPMAQPPNCCDPEHGKWFRTSCYEGSTMLLNEDKDYYQDPMKYYLDVIDALVARGVRFITWSDLDSDRYDANECNILLQFDVDAGSKSMERILGPLLQRQVRATMMLHRDAYDWYNFSIDDLDIDLLKEAEGKGYDIGYHNNSLSNVQRRNRMGDYSDKSLAEASVRFAEDIECLRQYFNVQYFTHHGGNSLNYNTPVPDVGNIVCVDKPFNNELWVKISTAFSDGSFLSRPCTFRKKMESCGRGVHFVRNHPVKYANYQEPFEILPLVPGDAAKAGCELNPEFWKKHYAESEKQEEWLSFRRRFRLAKRLGYSSERKPISKGFRDFSEVAEQVVRLRDIQGSLNMRWYPSEMGDPSVFWCRMLASYAPIDGEIMNLSVLSSGLSDEVSAFLTEGLQILNMNIEPTFGDDFANTGSEFNERFDGVLLFDLSYIHSPSDAIEVCLRMMKPGGLAMFGFVSDTHPLSGGMLRPETRPVFRKAQAPLDNIGFKGKLWSFDRQSVRELFPSSEEIEVSIEFFSHHWFVVCECFSGDDK